MKIITLKRGKEESLLRFHPWVFSGAIKQAEEGIEEGEIVEVNAENGAFIAIGHYQRGSIAVRVLTFDNEAVDNEFWCRRLASALQVRIATGIADTPQNNTYRLIHGEGDMMPGLIIDIYGRTAVIQAHSVGMHLLRHTIAEQLIKAMEGRIDNVYYKSESTISFVEPENGFLIGGSDVNTAMENGLTFHVDWLSGQKTGFFVDQRDNRSLVERYARGRHVLNMFCYTGGFSVYAMRGGAELVHSVDASQKAIDLTRRNVALNFPDDQRHEAYCEDAFKFLDNTLVTYDLVILDPPAFAKHRGAIHNALKGYTRLNNKAFEKIAKGGLLFTFSCSQVVTKDQFRAAVFTAAAQAHRRVRILHQLHQPADHPINIYHPEGEYLKGLVLYVE